MKRFPQKEIHLDEKEFKTDLGKGNYIFIGSSTDIFAKDVPVGWHDRIFKYIKQYPQNIYLFQSKNPWNMHGCEKHMPSDAVVATTIETNREEYHSNAGTMEGRATGLSVFYHKKLLTIEPIIDFDLREMLQLIDTAKPNRIAIGADTGHNNLKEPCKTKIQELITQITMQGYEIYIKDNLQRIVGNAVSVPVVKMIAERLGE